MATTARTEGELEKDIAALKADMAKLVQTISSLAAQKGDEAYRSVSDAKAKAQRRAGEMIEDAQSTAYEYRDEVNAAIERNPMTAVLIALGLGFVIGMMSKGGR